MTNQRQRIFASGFALVLVITGLSVLLALPAEAVSFTAPAPNTTSGTSQVTVTMTFDQDDLLEVDAVQFILVCTSGATTRVVIEEFGIDGTRLQADGHTVGNAAVSGELVNHGYGAGVGDIKGKQSGYGYTAGGGYGYATGDTSIANSGTAGAGYGYVVGAAGQDLSYTFTLDRSKFAFNESCYAVLGIDTPLAGDFMSPRSATFTPRPTGNVSTGGSGPGNGQDDNQDDQDDDTDDDPPANVDTDGDGVPDAVEIQEGTDPTDPNDFPEQDDKPDVPADSDGDGVPDQVETRLGTDPNDADSTPDFKVQGATATRTPSGVRVEWPVPSITPSGFQIWRSTSPWVHLADIPADQTFFLDEDAPEGAVYMVTFFVGTNAGQGYVDPASDPHLVLPGFPDEGEGISPEGTGDPVVVPDPSQGPGGLGRGTWWTITLGVVVVAAAIAVGIAMVLQRQEHGKK